MKLTILGMNGPFPAPGGATSGYLVTCGSAAIALDLGSGCLAQLTARTAPESLNALLLTHWHYDHCADVLPLIYRLEACAQQPLHLYAPVDEASPVRQAVQQCTKIILHNVEAHTEFRIANSEFRITPSPARHPVPAVMYRITDGTKTLCYTGDTNTVDGLTDFARDADLLLADGLFPTAAWAEGKPHLSAAHCAQLSLDAGAKKLVITHLNPLFDTETLLREARAIRIDSRIARIGDQYDI
ncbi:MAG: MBL fold metallo-hydrolase [Clostridia bacterium]|nr:MBL fold metallo-hydrolase [Clostridia bacterium]